MCAVKFYKEFLNLHKYGIFVNARNVSVVCYCSDHHWVNCFLIFFFFSFFFSLFLIRTLVLTPNIATVTEGKLKWRWSEIHTNVIILSPPPSLLLKTNNNNNNDNRNNENGRKMNINSILAASNGCNRFEHFSLSAISIFSSFFYWLECVLITFIQCVAN